MGSRQEAGFRMAHGPQASTSRNTPSMSVTYRVIRYGCTRSTSSIPRIDCDRRRSGEESRARLIENYAVTRTECAVHAQQLSTLVAPPPSHCQRSSANSAAVLSTQNCILRSRKRAVAVKNSSRAVTSSRVWCASCPRPKCARLQAHCLPCCRYLECAPSHYFWGLLGKL